MDRTSNALVGFGTLTLLLLAGCKTASKWTQQQANASRAGASSDELIDEFEPEGLELVRNVTVEFNENSDAHESGAHVATITVDLLESSIRTARIDDILSL